MSHRLKILADNRIADNSLKMCWGFSCLIDDGVLFDTGENSETLAFNMGKMGVQAEKITKLVISHDHYDHTGGLKAVLEQNPNIKVYLLSDFSDELKMRVSSLDSEIVENDDFIAIEDEIYTTGKIEGEYGGGLIPEQSMVIKGKEGLTIVTGCSHPLITDVVEIVKKNFPKEKISLVLGGFHLLEKSAREVEYIAEKMKELSVEKVGPTHCTGEEAINLFREKFGDRFVSVGAGAEIEI